MEKIKVLFVCVHNSARSQMAEEFLKQLGGKRFEVESAGLEPGKLNQIVVKVMQEVGIDISQNKTKSVFDLFKAGKRYHYVVTVCDESNSEKCPIFPSTLKRIHWGFKDPASFTGTEEDRLAKTRIVRDQIKETLQEWINIIADH